jgi:hypothetical protein
MIIDLYLDIVEEIVQRLDDHLKRETARAAKLEDPDLTTAYDAGEYICGLGFATLQQYMTHFVDSEGQSDNRAHMLNRGPTHKCGQTYAALVNAAANHWKHSTEWEVSGAKDPRARQSIFPLRQLGVDLDNEVFVLTHSLTLLMHPNPARFQLLVPFLSRWRGDVVQSIKDGRR